jgi:hypothetical protein
MTPRTAITGKTKYTSPTYIKPAIINMGSKTLAIPQVTRNPNVIILIAIQINATAIMIVNIRLPLYWMTST